MENPGSESKIWRFGDPAERPVACIRRGGLLAIPTESSYGLAVDPTRPEAVDTVFRIKGRPAMRPLPVVVGDYDALAALGVVLDAALAVRLRRLWPAPLTVVLPIRKPLPASAGQSTLAIRIPRHEGLRRLLRELGSGLTATSANLSGERAIVAPGDLLPLVAGLDALVIDDGLLAGGEPSTLVRPDGDGWQVLRRGAFPLDRLGGDVVEVAP